jgi:hypothetical protein
MSITALLKQLEALPNRSAPDYVRKIQDISNSISSQVNDTAVELMSDRNTIRRALRYHMLHTDVRNHTFIAPTKKPLKVVSKLVSVVPTLKPHFDGSDDFI